MTDLKKINDLEGYFINEEGKIFSTKQKTLKQLKTRVNSRGYEEIKIQRNNYKVHRLVAIAYISNPENLPQVNHIDGNKLNNDVSNLEWATNSDNQYHAWKTGLQPKRHASNASLTQKEADAIREEYVNTKIGTLELSRKYNVSKTTIKDILNAKYYNLDKTIKPVSRKKTPPSFTPEQVIEIRELYATGEYSYNKLGKMFGVNHKTIKGITERITYKHIESVTTN